MRASIVIAAHNEGEALWRTIRSCVETSAGVDYEIIVADDASSDGSVVEAQRRFPRLRVIGHDKRRGTSPTKDLGARHARGEVLVFVDGHCNPQHGAIDRLVRDVEGLAGNVIVTPRIPALDVHRWRNDLSQAGHGYRLDLETFGCGWLDLSQLRQVREDGRKYYESSALIGCALAVARDLYERLWGFDPHMRMWGVEDLDFGLKCWLMGHRILHDPEATIGHRFRCAFDNYSVPPECVLINQLRMARKAFTQSVWEEWVEGCRRRHGEGMTDHAEGLWAHAWKQFDEERPSVEQERSYLQANRQRDEFWYAEQFRLEWPTIGAEGVEGRRARRPYAARELAASPSPSPCPGVTVTFSPAPVKTGYSLPLVDSTLATTVTATVDPKARVADISFRMAGKDSGLASLGPITKDATNGTAVFDVKGTGQSTNSSVTKIEAVCEGRVLASVDVKVLVPKKIATPYPEKEASAPTVENLLGDSNTRPPWYVPGEPDAVLHGTEVGLATLWYHTLTVKVNDQFDNLLDPLYNGQPVQERAPDGVWVRIQEINNGTYPDPVGPYLVRNQTDPNVFPAREEYVRPSREDSIAAGWHDATPKPNIPEMSVIQTLPVKVAGHAVGTISRRVISKRNPDTVEIQWPPD